MFELAVVVVVMVWLLPGGGVNSMACAISSDVRFSKDRLSFYYVVTHGFGGPKTSQKKLRHEVSSLVLGVSMPNHLNISLVDGIAKAVS